MMPGVVAFGFNDGCSGYICFNNALSGCMWFFMMPGVVVCGSL